MLGRIVFLIIKYAIVVALTVAMGAMIIMIAVSFILAKTIFEYDIAVLMMLVLFILGYFFILVSDWKYDD